MVPTRVAIKNRLMHGVAVNNNAFLLIFVIIYNITQFMANVTHTQEESNQ